MDWKAAAKVYGPGLVLAVGLLLANRFVGLNLEPLTVLWPSLAGASVYGGIVGGARAGFWAGCFSSGLLQLCFLLEALVEGSLRPVGRGGWGPLDALLLVYVWVVIAALSAVGGWVGRLLSLAGGLRRRL